MTVSRADTEVRATEPGDGVTLPADGVRVERLRKGAPGEIVFLFPGAGGELTELEPLVSAFVGVQTVYGVALSSSRADRALTCMKTIAESVLMAIRQVQPKGPYRLGGYSFGGLLALEAAHQLTASGETVAALFLIDAVSDERYWPRKVWRRALVRRTRWQLLRIVRMRPTRALAELRFRGGRLIRRLLRRRTDAPDALLVTDAENASFADRAAAAMSSYRPRHYAGEITLIASSTDRYFGCDTTQTWEGCADSLVVQRVEGDHLTVMLDPASAAEVARVIDYRLATARKSWIGLKPMPGFERPMILTTMRWFAAARLAHALIEAGFSVSACRPRGHALGVVEGLVADCSLNRLWRRRSLIAALRTAQPDIILADDERALALLRRLHSRVQRHDPQLAALIAHSVGRPDEWPSLTSRAAFASAARALGISTPATAVIGNAEELDSWTDRLPMVLKTDGSWGGRGTAIVRERSQVQKTWRRISSPPRLPRGLKRAVFDLEIGLLSQRVRGVRPVVNVQEFVDGREAIATVACFDGEVQALGCFEVVQASEPKGPAAVVRVIEHDGMADAARRLVRRYGLSGFCGFDFILTEAGDPWLLEVNPRVTPTCHLLVEGDYRRPRTVTLFPARPKALDAPAASPLENLDVPRRAPALMRFGERVAGRQPGYSARATRWLSKRSTWERC